MLMDENSQSILEMMEDTTSHSLLNSRCCLLLLIHVYMYCPSLSIAPEPAHKEEIPRLRLVSTGTKRNRCGSFLKRSSTASFHRPSSSAVVTPGNVGANSGRGFIFQKINTPTLHLEKGSKKVSVLCE